MADYDEWGVYIPPPARGYVGEPRYDDEHRGPAVREAYSLSRCWIDLAVHSRNWPNPASIPDQLKAIAQRKPADQRDAWLKDTANEKEVDRLLSYAIQSGELPIWVAPTDGPETPVNPESILEIDRPTLVSGTYRPPNDDGAWLFGRPLFVKRNDWVRFVAKTQAGMSRTVTPPPEKPMLPPAEPFVTLSHALSWIAFGVSMNSDQLHEVLSEDRYGEHDPQEAIKAAVAQLVELGRGKRIAMQAKYCSSHREEKRTLLTAPIEPIKLADYRQFNYLSDELRHGEGLTWWRTDKGVTDRLVSGGRHDSYTEVSVDRVDLLREFPGHGARGWKPDAILWSDLDPPSLERAQQLAHEAETDEWWNWPQAVAWVGARSLEHIATMRLSAEPWKKRPDYDPAIALGAELFLASAYCSDLEGAERDLQRAIERGTIRTLGRETVDSPSRELKPLDWRGGKVVYNRTATLVSASNLLSEWACDIAVNRAGLWDTFPGAAREAPTASGGIDPQTNPIRNRKRPGPAPDPDWPDAIASVAQECNAAGYKRPLKRGQKAAIQTMLLNYMSARNKNFSEDIARKHAESVIAALPDK